MSHHIRQRSNAFELRIKHKLLPAPYYGTFSSHTEAEKFALQAESILARGVVPEGLKRNARVLFTDIAGAISAYEHARAVPVSTSNVLRVVRADVGRVLLSNIDYAWAEDWVCDQKLIHHRSPGTIRHHRAALSVCLDWVTNRYPSYLASNPLRRLPRGYSTYNEREERVLAEKGIEPKFDIERDRRIDNDEEQRILKAFEQFQKKDDARRREWHMAGPSFFVLALETAMRMREMYTLEIAQVDLPKRTIFLKRTKNGDRREVPLSSRAVQVLSELIKGREGRSSELLFPFWDGRRATNALNETSAALSKYFRSAFEAAQCTDLVFHDTRHEATCRLVLSTDMEEIEISRVTGHKSPTMLRRYMSLRGAELAKKLR